MADESSEESEEVLDLGVFAFAEEVEDSPFDDSVTPNPKAAKDRIPLADKVLRTKTAKPRGRAAGDRADDKRKKPVALPPKRKGQWVEPITQIYNGMALVLMPIDPVCANAIMQSAENAAVAWDELAYQNENVRRWLYALTTTSATTKVFIANLPILTAVILHHVPVAQRMMGQMGSKMAEQIAEQMNANKPNDPPNG